MEFANLIESRYSVRNYRPEHLPREILQKILDAGHLAPTGCNYQPQRILVLNTDEAMEKLRKCTRSHFHAPTALLVCHCTGESWVRPYDSALASPVDAAIVATHMMLAAHDLGVGCCWVMHFNPAAMRQTFAIPEGTEPLALLMLGYPAADAKPIAMHFKTRPMEETVVWDSF